jgi:hypothetical protein
MPADHGLRPDDLQSVQHAGCQPIQPGKCQTVDAAEGYSLRRFTSQHVELMTKRQDLCLQRRSRPEQSGQRRPNQAANISHQPRASPNSTSLASRIEFPTVTGGETTSALWRWKGITSFRYRERARAKSFLFATTHRRLAIHSPSPTCTASCASRSPFHTCTSLFSPTVRSPSGE